MGTASSTTAIPKKVDVSTNDGKTFDEKVFFLELWSIGNTASQKTIEIKGEENRNGPFRQIQFRFDKDRNYVYTKSDVNQKGFDETYAGTASEYSISGLSTGSAKTVIRIGRTNNANDVAEQYNGPAERVEVKVETATISGPIIEPGEGSWISEKWDNGNSRTIGADQTDPDEPKLKLLKVGDILPRAEIDGRKGECEVFGSSPRLYFSVPNKDVEMSAEVMVTNDVEIAHLIVRSNHEDRPDGHGGYYLYCNMKDNKVYFKCEETHEKGYSPRLGEKTINFTKDAWHKMVMRATNDGGSVVLEGKFDDVSIRQRVTEDRFIYQGEGKWCFIRTNDPNGVKYRNVQIKAI
jgi:hypothetical protein